MAVPIGIFIVCMALGAFAAAQWLPNLEAGPVGGLAFFAVCGLAGAGLGVIGLRIYMIVESEAVGRLAKGPIVAGEFTAMLYEAGALLGLAAAIYLLAPAPPELDEDEASKARHLAP